jgi:NCAIR mutase (PurE)-related protein
MNMEKIRQILEKVQRGELNIEEALERLKYLPYEDINFAKVDHQRSLTRGFSEVIFGKGKTPEQIASIADRILSMSSRLLITKAEPEVFTLIREKFQEAQYNPIARTISVLKEPLELRGKIAIACAGTSDLPVAEEAYETARILGSYAEKVYDVGVAGLHRVLDNLETLNSSNVIIAIAGMEGALPSVIGGLTSKPIIAVPTSVGYGAHFSGLSSLLTMLNTCVPGIAVVNIDNGFGAGYIASMINLMVEGKR